jgi:hypothetical protein
MRLIGLTLLGSLLVGALHLCSRSADAGDPQYDIIIATAG